MIHMMEGVIMKESSLRNQTSPHGTHCSRHHSYDKSHLYSVYQHNSLHFVMVSTSITACHNNICACSQHMFPELPSKFNEIHSTPLKYGLSVWQIVLFSYHHTEWWICPFVLQTFTQLSTDFHSTQHHVYWWFSSEMPRLTTVWLL